MKRIKTYKLFKESKINENLFTDIISTIWDNISSLYTKMKDKFGEHAWEGYLDFLKKEKKLPKGVSVIEPSEVSKKQITWSKSDIDDYMKMGNDESIITEALEHDDQNIEDSTSEELIEMIKDAYEYRIQRPGNLAAIFIWGASGIGKTEIVKQAGKSLDIKVIEFHLSQIDNTDFKGLPFVTEVEVEDEEKMREQNKKHGDDDIPTKTEKRSKSAMPMIFPSSNATNGKGGILFFDELNLATTMVLGAAMPLINDGTYNDYVLPSKWIIISAGNRKSDVSAELAEIDGPLGARFEHTNYIPSVKSWTIWANTKEYVDSRLVAFLNFKDEWFHVPLKEGTNEEDEDLGHAWPNPRAWTQASDRCWVKDKDFNLPVKKLQKIYALNVGRVAAQEFINYMELIKVLSVEDMHKIYTDGKIPKLPKAVDTQYAIITAIAYLKGDVKMTLKEFKNLLKFVKSIESFEVITFFLKIIRKANKNGEKEPYYKTDPKFKPVWDVFAKKWYNVNKSVVSGKDGNWVDRDEI